MLQDVSFNKVFFLLVALFSPCFLVLAVSPLNACMCYLCTRISFCRFCLHASRQRYTFASRKLRGKSKPGVQRNSGLLADGQLNPRRYRRPLLWAWKLRDDNADNYYRDHKPSRPVPNLRAELKDLCWEPESSTSGTSGNLTACAYLCSSSPTSACSGAWSKNLRAAVLFACAQWDLNTNPCTEGYDLSTKSTIFLLVRGLNSLLYVFGQQSFTKKKQL